MSRRRPLLIAMALAVLLAALLLGLAAATPFGPRLAAWAVERVSAPGLELEAPAGSILGSMRIGRVIQTTPEWRMVAEDVELHWRPGGLADGVFLIETLKVGRLEVKSRPGARAPEAPTALTLPMAFSVRKFAIAAAEFGTDGEKDGWQIDGLEGRGASDGRRHRLEALRFSTARLTFDASGELDGLAPFPLAARLRIVGKEPARPFAVDLKADGPLRALKLVARSARGPAHVNGEAVLDLFGRRLVRGTATADELDPADWVSAAPHAHLHVQAEFGAANLSEGALHGDIAIVNRDPGRLDEGRMPLRRLTAAWRSDGRRIVVPRFTAALAGGEATGTAAWAEEAFFVAARLSGIDAAAWRQGITKTRLNGDLKLIASPGARVHLEFTVRDSTVAGHPLAGHGNVLLRADTAQADVNLRAGDNAIEAHGGLGEPGDTLRIVVNAPRLDQIGLGGMLRGDATLSGRLRAPAARWMVDAPRLLIPGAAHVRGLATQGVLEAGGNIDVKLTVEHLALEGRTPPLSKVSVAIDGRRGAHRAQAVARVGDRHTLRTTFAGAIDGDEVWRGRIETLAWQGPRPLRLSDAARLEFGAGHLIVGRAAIAGEDWQAVLDGLRWEPGRLQSSGRFGGLPVGTLLPASVAAATLRIGGEWTIDFGRRAEGRVRVFREQGDISLEAGTRPLALGLERFDLVADFAGHQATVSLDAAGVRAGTLTGRLTAGLRVQDGRWRLARQAPWQGSLRLDTPSLAWLSPLAGENVLLGGHLEADVDLGGTPAVPATHGRVAADGVRVRLLDYGLDMGGGVLRLDFTPEVARLQRFELESVATQRPRERRIDVGRLAARPGRLVAEGEIALKENRGAIRLQADRVVVSELPDRWVMLSGTGNARLAEGELAIAGDLAVDAAYVELARPGQPTLSADVVVIGRQEKDRRLARTGLDFNLRLGEQFYFQGAGMRSRLAGELRLVADPRTPLRARGSVQTVDGTFDAFGRELAVERGILNFQGFADNPGLNVRALRKNQAVEAGVEVGGTLKDPRIRLVSVPEVPDTEKLSWMVLGRAPGGATGAEDADLLLSAAMALRGSRGKGPMQSLMQGLGLEEFGISSGSLAERSRFPAAHVAGSFDRDGVSAAERIATIGKRVGANAVLSYEHSLTSAESIVKLTVELTRRISVVGRMGADNAIGLIYSFAFGGGTQ